MIKKGILAIFAILLTLSVTYGADVVLVSDNCADCAAAEEVANVINATVITTTWGIYDEDVVNKIISLNPDKVIIVGGNVAVVDNYTSALESAGISVERVGGATRYDTNKELILKYQNEFTKRYGDNLTLCVVHGNDDIGLNETMAMDGHCLVVLTNGTNLSVEPERLQLKIRTVEVINNPISPFNNSGVIKKLQRMYKVKEVNISLNKVKLALQNRIRLMEMKIERLQRMGIDTTDLQNKLNEVKTLMNQNRYEEAYRVMLELEGQQMARVKLHLHGGYGKNNGMGMGHGARGNGQKGSIMINNNQTTMHKNGARNAPSYTTSTKIMGSNGNLNTDMMKTSIMELPKEPLSDVEKSDLIMMREEEKLARDVYLTLYNKWKLPIFRNIASAEITHMTSVKYLLDKYGISDPVSDDTVGVFKDEKYTQLYNQLVEKGDKSIVDALQVGMIIEDMDIADLQECINNTDNEDIKLVYENLMKGSRNHMRAFYKNLIKYGGNYTPEYISYEEYESIINSPTERGVVIKQ